MKITYDKKAEAVYIYISPIEKGSVDHTVEITDNLLIDYQDANNTIPLGIEILGVETLELEIT